MINLQKYSLGTHSTAQSIMEHFGGKLPIPLDEFLSYYATNQLGIPENSAQPVAETIKKRIRKDSLKGFYVTGKKADSITYYVNDIHLCISRIETMLESVELKPNQ